MEREREGRGGRGDARVGGGCTSNQIMSKLNYILILNNFLKKELFIYITNIKRWPAPNGRLDAGAHAYIHDTTKRRVDMTQRHDPSPGRGGDYNKKRNRVSHV